METWADFGAPRRFRFLQLVKLADVGGGEDDGFPDVCFQFGVGAVKIFRGCGNGVFIDEGSVKLLGKARQGLVTFEAHGLDNGNYLFEEGSQIAFGALEKAGAVGGCQV